MDITEVKRRMHGGEIYDPSDPKLIFEQLSCLRRLKRFNRSGLIWRMLLAKKMFAEIGEKCYIEPPMYANWGCKHVHFGVGVYANFNLTLTDDTHIYVGNRTMFGPNVAVITAAHPFDPALRDKGLQYNKPVKIGRSVWIGANAVILPGVTIGDNSVIGAGSLVTRDIPANVVAYGSPCRVIRGITEADLNFYDKDKPLNGVDTEKF
ncbi:MAG: sugar O-acetyltransferase [Clostridiales bacterium]|jgi:galactoside O-acetyltransferase|nr:sugar O-acetyltransferase [Clostridiales bacterium]